MPLNEDLKAEILRGISSGGAAEEENQSEKQIILGSRNNIGQILNTSSGLPKLRTDVIKKFNFILSTPAILSSMSPFEIRCVLCKKVISYPCWYYSIRYAINHFHYFICFDVSSNDKPSMKCYKRG